MRRRRLVVPVLVALSGFGWAATHALAHRAVMPEPGAPAPAVEGYLSYLTTSIALCLALALPLAAGAVAGSRRRGTSLRSLWLFGLVPLLGFVGHAVAEPALAGATEAPGLAEIAPFLLVAGLIQVVFALSAIALARGILSLAEALAHTLARRMYGEPPRGPRPARPPGGSHVPAFSVGLVHSGRGPPPHPA